jgi:1-deoxy-D-xylulose-5-phosphate synthase
VGSGLNASRIAAGDGSVAILAVGKMVGAAEQAVAQLNDAGIRATLWDVRSCAPLDPAMIADAATHRCVVTVEDGYREGGIGLSAIDALRHAGFTGPAEALGVPTKFIPHAKPDVILSSFGLDAAGIAASAKSLLS